MTKQARQSGQRVRRETIAERAGVSPMTVTRALRGGQVKEETRQRIMAICRELGYRANLTAMSLRLNRSWLIGLLVPAMRHEFWHRVISVAERCLDDAGYHLVVLQTGSDFAWDRIDFLLQRNPDGLIQAAACTDAVYRELAATGVRTVLLNTETEAVDLPRVSVDHAAGARLAVAHLLALGHRRIAHLGGKPREFSARERERGYREALAAAGIAVDPQLLAPTDYHFDGGATGARELLARQARFTAIFAANDYAAIGAMRVLADHGLRVPEDVSVVGFSGDSVGDYSCPRLTTVDEPVETMVPLAIDLLLNHQDVRKEALRPALVERDSCAPPPPEGCP